MNRNIIYIFVVILSLLIIEPGSLYSQSSTEESFQIENNDADTTAHSPQKLSLDNQSYMISDEGNAILKKVDENLLPESYESYKMLSNIEPNGRRKDYTFYTVKKGKDKISMLYLSPAQDKGRSTLRIEDNIWLYIPNVGKPIRITSLQSVVGGVFNNSDIMRLDFHVEYNVVNLEKTSTEYIMLLKAKNNRVAYDRIKMWVLQEGLKLIKVECYAASGILLKTLEFKNMKDFGDGIVRPAVIETISPLYKGYKSLISFSIIKRRQFPDEVFTLNFLPRLEELR